MKLLYPARLVALLLLVTLAACSDKPEYPATDSAISDAGSDVGSDGDTSNDADASDAADATDTVDTGPCQDACSGETPHCDTEAATCVPCLDDTHCADGVCTEANTCVECAEDDDCTEGVCDTDTNTCVACNADDDCTEGVCDTENNTCVECLHTDDCAEGVCDTESNTCVECLQTDDCAEGVCNTSTNACVECLINDNCLEASASYCDLATNTCTFCADNDDCSHLSDQRVCDTSGASGVCVECTVDDETPCGGNSCDPATNTCTSTPRGQTQTCQPCKADSECIADHRCVPMEFQGTPLPDGYCLKMAAAGCDDPFQENIVRGSRSRASSAAYCGIDEDLTTCTAVLDGVGDKWCSSDAACGMSQHSDAECILGFNQCTYPCSHHGQCEGSCTIANLCGIN